MTEFTHDTFISPFTWRFGSDEMRSIWSEVHKRTLFRRVWIALARAQMHASLVTAEQVAELESRKSDVDIARSAEIEALIKHDLMAEIKVYAEQCPKAASIIHLGATSTDVLDNAEALRLKEALHLILEKTQALLGEFIIKMRLFSNTPCMAFTHIQPAEPTTVGYRMAQTAQDLISHIAQLEMVQAQIKGKGIKGAVGTAASYGALLNGTGISARDLEAMVMDELGLNAFIATTQVYPRSQDLLLLNTLSQLAATLHKFALDFRMLQSPPIGEWSEPFGAMQVGSSAMPFKRNPINCEKIDSLCRHIAALPAIAWGNASSIVLERTLDDSANRRSFLPEAFLAIDEVLVVTTKTVAGMQIHETGIKRNMEAYGLFAATERVLMELGRKGANRQEMHEVIRTHSLTAWQAVQLGKPNPLLSLLLDDARINSLLTEVEIIELMSADSYVGDAPLRTELIIAQAEKVLQNKE